ncbi:DUF2231 domain-containing protein [Halomonas sp. TRM85114]|uniref:DUF2231 domain-containing protein n=1 Tax=Halomonas jincaotanensis TaxID=2810616 RepID=UPI001BD5F471|nr:DUF2231 domain-containing protein [Halomonas jincaotanensis]MBS9404014.1 DUF2231 domain-containing protein [Halomonas jincaotanensis]
MPIVTQQRSIRSRAAIAGHPLHPVMIHFPVALLLALVASDLGYLYTQDPFWARVSLWLAGVGALGGWTASVAGVIDLVSVGRIRRMVTAWSHALVAVLLLSLASLNWLWRLNGEALLPWGLVLSLITAVLIALAGFLGGQLVYDHAVGVEVEE